MYVWVALVSFCFLRHFLDVVPSLDIASASPTCGQFTKHVRKPRSSYCITQTRVGRKEDQSNWYTRLVTQDASFLGGSDMRQVAALRGEIDGEGIVEEFTRLVFGNILFRGGSTSYILAAAPDGNDPPLSPSPLTAMLTPRRGSAANRNSSKTSSQSPEPIVAFSQLGRLAMGGFIVLRNDFLISTVLVREEWRMRGIGKSLIQELLHRLPRKGLDKGRQEYHAWAFTDSKEASAFLEAAGGEVVGNIWQVFIKDPLVALALLISGFAPLQLVAGAQVIRFKALGDVSEYTPQGRLTREVP